MVSSSSHPHRNLISKSHVFLCLGLCFIFSLNIGFHTMAAPSVSYTFIKRGAFSAFGQLQGAFTLVAQVSNDVVRVELFLDRQLVLNDTSSPFQWDFDTHDYAPGQHNFDIIAYNSEGETATISFIVEFIIGFPLWYILFMVGLVALIPLFGLFSLCSKQKEKKGGL